MRWESAGAVGGEEARLLAKRDVGIRDGAPWLGNPWNGAVGLGTLAVEGGTGLRLRLHPKVLLFNHAAVKIEVHARKCMGVKFGIAIKWDRERSNKQIGRGLMSAS